MLIIKNTQITQHPKRITIYKKYNALLVNETIQFYDSNGNEKLSLFLKNIKDFCNLKDTKTNKIYLLLKYDFKLELISIKNCKFIKICKLKFQCLLKEWSCSDDIVYLNTEDMSFIINIQNKQLIGKNIQKFHDPFNLQITKLSADFYNFQYLNTFNLSRYIFNLSSNTLKPQELFKTNAIKIFNNKMADLIIFNNFFTVNFNSINIKNFNMKMPKNLFFFNVNIIEFENIIQIWNGDGSIIEINLEKRTTEFVFIEKINCFGLKKSHDVLIKKVGIKIYENILKNKSHSIKPLMNSDNCFYKTVIYDKKIVVLTESVFVIENIDVSGKFFEIINTEKIVDASGKFFEIINTEKIVDASVCNYINSKKIIFIAFKNTVQQINHNCLLKQRLISSEKICVLKVFSNRNSLLVRYKNGHNEDTVIFFKDKVIELSQLSLNESICIKEIKNIYEIHNLIFIHYTEYILVIDGKTTHIIELINTKVIYMEAFRDSFLVKFFGGKYIIFKTFEDLKQNFTKTAKITGNIMKYRDNLVVFENDRLFIPSDSVSDLLNYKEKDSYLYKTWNFSNYPKYVNLESNSDQSSEPTDFIKSFKLTDIYLKGKEPCLYKTVLILETELEIIVYEKIRYTFYKKFQIIGKKYYEIFIYDDVSVDHLTCSSCVYAVVFYPKNILFNSCNGLVLRDLSTEIQVDELYNASHIVFSKLINFFNYKSQDIKKNLGNLLYFNSTELFSVSISPTRTTLINIRKDRCIEFLRSSEEFICVVTSKKDKMELPNDDSVSSDNPTEEEEKEDEKITLRRSTNLTILKKHIIEVYRHNIEKKDFLSEKIGSLKFESNEVVTDLRIKKGFQTDNFIGYNNDETSTIYYVTTTKLIGRNLQSIGFIYLYGSDLKLLYKIQSDVVIKSLNLFDFPIQPMKSYNLYCEFNTNPQNRSNLNHFFDTTRRNIFAVGCGDQLKIYNSHTQFMEPIAFYDLNQLIEYIYCIKNYVIVVDRKMGVHLFLLQLEPIQLHLLCSSNLPVEGILINLESKAYLRTLNPINYTNLVLNKTFLELDIEKELHFIVKKLMSSTLNVLTYIPTYIKEDIMVLRSSYKINSDVKSNGNIMFSKNSIFFSIEYIFFQDESLYYNLDKFIEVLLLKQEKDLCFLNNYKINEIAANKILLVGTDDLKYFLMSNEKYKKTVCKLAGVMYSEIIGMLKIVL
ncbi:hypothetical protein CDIK_0273 [Cucumispora dikerogammari]|nr:hypothetical protein CDIK_0273 [Cucumispora dikerogammari]